MAWSIKVWVILPLSPGDRWYFRQTHQDVRLADGQQQRVSRRRRRGGGLQVPPVARPFSCHQPEGLEPGWNFSLSLFRSEPQ